MTVMGSSSCIVFRPSKCKVRAASRPIVFPPDPDGSGFYLVCNRRKEIWRLERNHSGVGPVYGVSARRGPLWSYPPSNNNAAMGDIDGDSSGAWYFESPGVGAILSSGPSAVAFPELGFQFGALIPRLHRLDADLNLVASYIIAWKIKGLTVQQGSEQSGFFIPASSSITAGGSAANLLAPMARVAYQTLQPQTNPPVPSKVLDLPGGLCAVNFNTVIAACTKLRTAGKTVGGLIQVGLGEPGDLSDYASVQIDHTDKAIEVIPEPGYQSMLNEGFPGGQGEGSAPPIGSCGGAPGVIYACKLGGNDYIAKWVNGALAAYKTPANANALDQYKAQCIGGSSSVVYTTENNNEVVIRDGSLNLVRRFPRAELDTMLGPTSAVNGFSNYTFTGIGGR